MIKQLLNSVIAKYRDLSVSRRSIICLSLRLRQIIDLLATDKSRYFTQPCPIIVKYPSSVTSHFRGPWTVPVDPPFNPLNPNIKIEILIYCPYTFSTEVVGRICWNINQRHLPWSCTQFSWPTCFRKHRYYKEKFHADHPKYLKG